jgi:hypothetical protein
MGFTTWEMLYSHIKPKSVKYVPSVVSYLDILGFRELIKTRKPGEISRLLRILSESVKPGTVFKDENIRSTKFSDTVIRTVPATPQNFALELRSILGAHLALIPEGILIRGAVTVGEAVRSWGIVYGPGVIKAYDLERVAGAPPRIIVDGEALTFFAAAIEKEGLSPEVACMLRKEGSKSYIDYLGACEREFNVPEQEYSTFLELHRDLIRDGLTKHPANDGLLSKYLWLRDYHNRILEEQFGTDLYQHLRV